MTIEELAYNINEKSVGYEIGNLQSIRKDIKGFKIRPGSKIFSGKTIKDGWAFHHGGRSEIQFNIGYEPEGIRYGLAFSLETSHTLPDISILYPKIFKLNCLIREQPEFFQEFQMWSWQPEPIGRSKFSTVTEIQSDLINLGTFIFFGNIWDENTTSIDDILLTFDKLLWVYKIIETEIQVHINLRVGNVLTPFVFIKQSRILTKNVRYTSKQKEINIDIRHSFLQEELIAELEKKYGKANVSVENSFNGNRIDIVVKDGNDFHFYEVKTASSAKSCVRQAIGLLLEYAYGNGLKNATNIYVAGEFPIDIETDTYMNYLRKEFVLPIHYKQIEI